MGPFFLGVRGLYPLRPPLFYPLVVSLYFFSLALLFTEFRLNCVPCRPPPSTRVRKSQLARAVYLYIGGIQLAAPLEVGQERVPAGVCRVSPSSEESIGGPTPPRAQLFIELDSLLWA